MLKLGGGWRRTAKKRGDRAMTITYTPRGVCSQAFRIEVEDDVIRSVQVVGGCSGNLQGLSALLRGMRVEDAIQPVSYTHLQSQGALAVGRQVRNGCQEIGKGLAPKEGLLK